MPGKAEFPIEFEEAILSDITGWPPSVLDEQPAERLNLIVIFKAIKNVTMHGGEYHG